MSPISSYLPVWKDKLKRAKTAISKQLEEAKDNGGRKGAIRTRLKQELAVAKGLKKTIKEIENTMTQQHACPCCGCEFIIGNNEDGKQCLIPVKKEQQT